ncbi:unnamed protein product [Paramecium sonneborni]|uniref:Uncharacterized protein n=1 Tax=Paramecium sonneborni TaxID=65129 RepID=A0A8S1LWK0_9CILI|nr:unnamed protein product [Paramecium sonneborni]
MHQDPQNNEEIILLQTIEKDLSTDQYLQQICKQIGQQNQNPRLLIFLQELLKILFNSYLQKEYIQKAFEILNNILNKQKFKNRLIQNSDLSHYINQKYSDVLAKFYEKAFLKGPDDAFKHINFVYYQKIVKDYMQSPHCQNLAITQSILQKIDSTYQNFIGNTPQEFEMAVFECLNSQEQELLSQIVSVDQSKAVKQTNNLQERFLLNLPPDLQDKFKSLSLTDFYAFRDYLVQEKQNRGLEKILGYIFVDKLNFYLNSYYFVNSAKKIKQNKSDILKLLPELENGIMDSQKDYYSFIDIPYVKYFYKSLKSRKVRNFKRQCFSFKKKLTDLIKLEINSFQLPKKSSIAQLDHWREIYLHLYQELEKAVQIEESKIISQIIFQVQQLILSFLRFRWNYLYLFCALIVETNLQLEELDQILELAYDMMQNTNKVDLDKTFDQILAQLNQQTKKLIISDYFDKQGSNLGYQSLQVLENLLPSINNKLINVMLQLDVQIQNYQKPIRMIRELKIFEFQLIYDCSQNLKNYNKIFEKLTDSILEGEKDEKDFKAIFFKSYPLNFQQRLRYICNQRQNKQMIQQFYKDYYYNIVKLKQDFQKKKLVEYQEILQREDKIRKICEQYIQKEAEKFPGDVQKELSIYFDVFFQNNPFVIFLPSIIKGLFFFRPQKFSFFDKIERVRFAAVAFQDKDQNEIDKFIEFMVYMKDLFTFSEQFQIAQRIYNFYIKFPQFGGDQCKPINEQFPEFNQMKSINDYNSTTYNAICVFTSKFFGQDYKVVIKSEDNFRNNDFLKKFSNLMSEKGQYEPSSQTDIISNQFQELKNYKAFLIKEAQQFNDYNYINKCIEIFQKYQTKQFIMQEIIESKKQCKLPLNELELFFSSKNYWISIGNQEFKQITDSNQKKKVEEYFKSLINLPTLQLLNEKLQKDTQSIQDTYLKQLINKHYLKYKEELEKNSSKSNLQTNKIKQSILINGTIQKKLTQYRQELKQGEFQVEDQQVLTFIQDQFNLYMKQLLGKVFQAALTQKPGYEFKVFQNKPISQNDTQMNKYKQNQELQTKFGPQKNSFLDISLLTSSQNKNQLYYELCDYTPCQRQIEFRNYLIEIESPQEDKLKNKIRKNKWREEHPELEEVLKKRIKRGAELWNQVQDFLCKRESNENVMNSDDESDKYKGQQQQCVDMIEDDQLDQKIQELQRNFEKQLLTGKSYIKTRLNNMDNDNPLLTLKEITVKTVQFVLEQHPYFKKSKILYKSYIL